MAEPALYALHVDDAIVAKCRELLPTLAQQIGIEKFDAVLRELYLDEFMEYDQWGKMQADLTDLQIVAVTFAVRAYIKAGAEWDGIRAWAGRFGPGEVTFP